MSAQLAIAQPRRIKASHRRRRKVTVGHFVQRYYDPQIGRFLSVDPVGVSPVNGLNFNRYWYASNNPYTNKDPDGRCDGPSTCAIDRDIAAMNSGEMSRSEFMDRSEARGAGAIIGVAMIAAVVSPNVRNGLITAGLETSMQAGKQMAVDGKAASEVTIDKSDVAVAGVIGAFAPGAITTLSQVRTSVSAIRTLGAQATNTAARAVKIAGRIQAHASSLKTAVGAWVASKIATASTQEAVNKADELETKK